LEKSALGLKQFYGYTVGPLPDSNALDDGIHWVRAAIDFVVRSRHRDVAASKLLSLRRLLGETRWAAGATSRHWEFDLPPGELPVGTMLRLRGLSMFTYVEREPTRRLVRGAVIRLPKTGTITYPPVPGLGPLAPQSVDQSDLPPCTFSRVSNRLDVRPPEMVVGTSINNASPIGSWAVTIGPRLDGKDAVVDDVELEMHLVLCPAS
jgi:hypothetical protein